MPSDDDADDGHELEIDSSNGDDTQGEEVEEELQVSSKIGLD